MFSRARLRPSALLAVLSLAPLAHPAQERAEKLNAPLEYFATIGDVDSFRVTPDGAWVVYRAQQDSTEPGLYAVSADGSVGPILLSEPGVSPGAFEITPSGQAIVFVSGPDLYRVTPAGGRVRLNAPLVSGGAVREFRVSPDGLRVAYLADQDVDERVELYSARLVGAPGNVKLSRTPVAGGDVHTLQFTPDGSRVVFGGSLLVAGRSELFVAPLDVSGADLPLCGAFVSGGSVFDLQSAALTPDGTRVVYIADQLQNDRAELFYAPLAGGGRVRLNAPLVLNGDVDAFRIAASGDVVAYRADQVTDGVLELFAVPMDGSAPPVEVNGSATPVGDFRLDPAGERVAFVTWSNAGGLSNTLWSAPLDGSVGPVQLSGVVYTLYGVTITPDSSRALYIGGSSSTHELFSVPLDGSASSVRVHAPLASGRRVTNLRITADGTAVVYRADAVQEGAPQLFRAPLDGSAAPVALHAIPASGAGAQDDFALGGDAVFLRGDLVEHGVLELFVAPLDALQPPLVLNGPLVSTPGVTDVSSFGVAPDGRSVAYGTHTAVFGVDLASTSSAQTLFGPGYAFSPFTQVRIDGGSEHVVFVGQTEGSHVYSVLLDGSAPAVRLSPGQFAHGFGFFGYTPSPDWTRVRFSASTYDGPGGTYQAPVDGSASAISVPGGANLAHTVDGTRIVYASGQFNPYADTPTRLFVRAADASTPAMELAPLPLDSVADTIEHALVPGDQRVVFVRDDEVGQKYELYSVALSGGAATKLSGTLAADRDVAPDLFPTPDATRVVYAADRDANDAFELYVVPVDGSGAPLELSGTLVAGGDIATHGWGQPLVWITPDSQRAVYVADALVDERFELFSVRLDGNQAPVALATPAIAAGDVVLARDAVQLVPDGSRLVFLGDLAEDQRTELHCVGVTGGPVVQVSGPTDADRDVEPGFVVLASGRDVLFRADLAANAMLELWLAPLDGRHRPWRRSALEHPLGDVEPDFVVGPDEHHVYYRADALVDERVELFRFPLRTPAASPR